MIKVYWGQPGQGKSYNAHKDAIIENLKSGEKRVITNLAVNIPELEKHIRKTRPAFILENEVKILTDEELGRWWAYKFKGDECITWNPELASEQYDLVPTVYVIDEGWQVASARKAGSVDSELEFFLRHHRRFGFDVVWITHHPSDVPKIIRNLVEQWESCQNHKYRAAMTVFKRPARFEVQVHRDASPGQGAVPMELTFPNLIPEIANTYNTQSSKGVTGTQADKNRKVKGISLMWIPVTAVLVCVLGWVGCTKTFNAAMKKVIPQKAQGATVKTAMEAPQGKPVEVQGEVRTAEPKQEPRTEQKPAETKEEKKPEDEEKLEVTGYFQLPDGEYMLCLSDGDVIKTPNKRVLAIGENGAIVDGKLARFQKRKLTENKNRAIPDNWR